MNTQVNAMGIIPTADVKATGRNVKTIAAAGLPFPGLTYIASNDISSGTVAPEVVVPPIPVGSIKQITKTPSRAEVRKITYVGRPLGTTAAPVRETIVAAKKYTIRIANELSQQETSKKPDGIYSVTAPAVLSGTEATDRLNVYTALVNKINAHATNNVEAFLVSSMAFTLGGATAVDKLPVVGEVITQAVTNGTAKVAAVWVGTGSIADGDAAGLIFLYDISSAWTDTARVLTGAGGFKCTSTVSTLTAGEGIITVDDAGYYPAGQNPRQGETSVYLARGFDANYVESGEANTLALATVGYVSGLLAQYSHGIGTRMLEDYPVFDREGSDVISGNAYYALLNKKPVAGETYTRFEIIVSKNTDIAHLGHKGGSMADFQYDVWFSESDATHLANFEVALETVSGLTIN